MRVSGWGHVCQRVGDLNRVTKGLANEALARSSPVSHVNEDERKVSDCAVSKKRNGGRNSCFYPDFVLL